MTESFQKEKPQIKDKKQKKDVKNGTTKHISV
jgi:hypothetical protein